MENIACRSVVYENPDMQVYILWKTWQTGVYFMKTWQTHIEHIYMYILHSSAIFVKYYASIVLNKT